MTSIGPPLSTADVGLPTVQVLLSTYNGQMYLEEQLRSILAQSGVEVRLLVRDDGSTDGTLDILHQYAREGAIELSAGRNVGVARSFLWLLSHAPADCDFVAFADQDDVWLHRKLERATTALADPDVAAMYCSALTLVDSALRPMGTWHTAPRAPSFENAVVQNIAAGCTIVINRSAYLLLTSRLPTDVDMHDWWMYQVIASVGRVIFDAESSILYRQHSANTVGAARSGIAGLESIWTRFATRGLRVPPAAQLNELERLFSDLWTPEQRALVRRMLDAPTCVSARLRLALGRGVVFQSPRQDVAFRVLAALGRV